MVIAVVDILSTIVRSLCAVLPIAIIDVGVKEEPGGAVWLSYRRFIKSALLPAVHRVAELLRKHAAIVEVSCTSMNLVHTQSLFADWGGCKL